jgi:integrase
MKQPYPWYSKTRSGGGWFVKLRGEQVYLGKHPVGAPAPVKRNGRWNAPSKILAAFHSLMADRDTLSKEDYPLEAISAMYVDELAETNPALATRYKQILGRFCDFVLPAGIDRGKRIGSLLVNAEAEGKHLRAWVEQFPSAQTQRSYINDVKAALTWAVKKKGLNISHNPFLALKAPKIESRAVVISREEHEALLRFWNNDCYCDFLQAMWYTGARPGEIAKIEARHLKDGLWLLEPTEHKTGRVTGKDRVIGVCDELYEIVDRLTRKNPTGPIFLNSYGRPWTTSASFVRFESARSEGIIREEVSPYAYRHAWATHALESGKLDLYEVAKALGHQTTQMVMLHYDHSRKSADHLRDIFKRARREATFPDSPDVPSETDNQAPPS